MKRRRTSSAAFHPSPIAPGDGASSVRPGLFDHARRARRIIGQNLVLSGVLIAVLITLSAAGAMGLGMVVAVHVGAEVPVIANGLRARRSGNLAAPSAVPVEPSRELAHAH